MSDEQIDLIDQAKRDRRLRALVLGHYDQQALLAKGEYADAVVPAGAELVHQSEQYYPFPAIVFVFAHPDYAPVPLGCPIPEAPAMLPELPL